MSWSPVQVQRAIEYALEKTGYTSLKEKQREAVEAFVAANDTFVSLPTGYGKSLCYSLLPLVFDFLHGARGRSIVVCISPLTSLMMDQRAKYAPRGLAIEMVGETQQDVDVMQRVQDGKYQLVYVSPEAIIGDSRWREMLHSPAYQKNLVAFVVDEAHCVIKW